MKLFEMVKCNGYLNKAKDSIWIEILSEKDTPDNIPDFCIWKNGKAEDNDVEDIEKTYFELKEKVFNGFIVGYKDIIIKGILGASYEEPEYGRDYIRLYKEPKEIIKCAIVYYGNNRKRYVPVENIIWEEKSNG